MEQKAFIEESASGSAYQPGYERRKSPRKKLQRRLALSLPTGEVLEGETIEISQGGIGVMLPRPLQLGSGCKLSFNMFLNGRRTVVTGTGKVMNCSCSGLNGFRVGMVFTITDHQAQEVILTFLQ